MRERTDVSLVFGYVEMRADDGRFSVRQNRLKGTLESSRFDGCGVLYVTKLPDEIHGIADFGAREPGEKVNRCFGLELLLDGDFPALRLGNTYCLLDCGNVIISGRVSLLAGILDRRVETVQNENGPNDPPAWALGQDPERCESCGRLLDSDELCVECETAAAERHGSGRAANL